MPTQPTQPSNTVYTVYTLTIVAYYIEVVKYKFTTSTLLCRGHSILETAVCTVQANRSLASAHHRLHTHMLTHFSLS